MSLIYRCRFYFYFVVYFTFTYVSCSLNKWGFNLRVHKVSNSDRNNPILLRAESGAFSPEYKPLSHRNRQTKYMFIGIYIFPSKLNFSPLLTNQETCRFIFYLRIVLNTRQYKNYSRSFKCSCFDHDLDLNRAYVYVGLDFFISSMFS